MRDKGLWVLIWDKSKEPVPPLDDNTYHEDQGMIVYGSKEAADGGAKHQNDLYEGSEDNGTVIAVPLSQIAVLN